ncbi:MAG TPA: hypothetical protein VFS08_18655 [Gemmatimonadaceae bacterium]|nr:hypothetical protein [Gemmatimonadaceae bacterium]
MQCDSHTDETLAPALELVPVVTDMTVGDTVQFSVAGATGPVAWSSSDITVATVDFGRVVAVDTGSTVILAVSGDESASTTIDVVRPAAIELGADVATFALVGGAVLPASAAITVANGGDRPLEGLAVGDVTYDGAAAGWLTATLDGTTAPATLTLAATADGLAPGVYGATVTITAPELSSRTVAVTLFTRTATLAGDVQPIFDARRCAGCHSGASTRIPDFTDATTSWNTLVGPAGGVPSSFCDGLDRVEPGDPARSCIFLKMSRMEPHPGPTLAGTDLSTLYAWILQGARQSP